MRRAGSGQRANEAPIAVGAGEPTHALTTLGLMDEFWFG